MCFSRRWATTFQVQLNQLDLKRCSSSIKTRGPPPPAAAATDASSLPDATLFPLPDPKPLLKVEALELTRIGTIAPRLVATKAVRKKREIFIIVFSCCVELVSEMHVTEEQPFILLERDFRDLKFLLPLPSLAYDTTHYGSVEEV